MLSFEFTVKDPIGIHARPAGLFVNQAKKYISSIEVKKGDNKGDAKKLFSLMKLGVKCGENVIVEISGEDEAKAVEEIKAFLEANL
jgi:phosphocarrier protein